MARLRGPGGCPWDHEQTHQSLREPLIEEAAELLDTIDREDYDHMREELGDVLLQVVFHCQIAAEQGRFDFADVAREINDKLIRRHPHVFGDGNLSDSAAVLQQWEAIKAAEKRNGPAAKGLFKRLPPALPALTHAWNVAKQIRKLDLRHPQVPPRAASRERAQSLDPQQAGQQLFELVCALYEAGIEPESALRSFSGQLLRDLEAASGSVD